MAKVKKYWQQILKENFYSIWNEAMKQIEKDFSSNHDESSEISSIQNVSIQNKSNHSQQSKDDPWSFLWFGPNYSSVHVNDYFSNWD